MVLLRYVSFVFALVVVASAQVAHGSSLEVTLADVKSYLKTNMNSKPIQDIQQESYKTKPTFADYVKGLNAPLPIVRLYYESQIVNTEIKKSGTIIKLMHDPSPVVRFVTAFFLEMVVQGGQVDQATTDSIKRELTNSLQIEKQPLLRQFLTEHIQAITSTVDETTLAKDFSADGLSIVVSSAKWCSWCKLLHAKLKEEGNLESIPMLAGQQTARIPIIFVDIDEDKNLVEQYHINKTGLPRFYLIQNGKTVYDSYFKYGYETMGVQKMIAAGFNGAKNSSLIATTSPEQLTQALNSKAATQSRVVLIGTGADRDENPLFVSETLKFVRTALQKSFGLGDDNFVTLYGSGPNSNQKDTLETIGFLPHYIKINDLNPDASFTPSTLAAVYDTDNTKGIKNTLLVFSGHGSREGLDTWGGSDKFKPEDLKKIVASSSGESVIVSGNCYGGQFYHSVSCGFFAARPDTVASGCWESDEDKVKDYSSTFFQSLKKSNKFAADVNKDGQISLDEAHWYAVLNGAESDVPYTSTDGLVELYFFQNPKAIPETMTLEDAIAMKKYATAAEKNAFDSLAKDVKPGIPFTVQERTVTFSLERGGQKYEGTVEVTPFASEWNYKAKFSRTTERFLEDELRKSGVSSKSMSGNEPLQAISLTRSVLGTYTFTGSNNLPANLPITNYLSATFSKNNGKEQAYTSLYDSKINVELGVGNNPNFIELVRRLAFKKALTLRSTEQSYKDRFKQISQCESQNLATLLR